MRNTHTIPSDAIKPEQTLAELATSMPGASRVFHRHGLDFCCNGRRTIAAACAVAGIDTEAVVSELKATTRQRTDSRDWSQCELPDLIDYILTAFHEPQRAEIGRLHAMAVKVEAVHGEKADCPRGLAELLQCVAEEMELHMQKEEQILFPAIRQGAGRMVTQAVRVMEEEHEDHGKNLTRIRRLTNNHTPPTSACNTWRALYLGLFEFEHDLMDHIHLENHVLFPRALA